MLLISSSSVSFPEYFFPENEDESNSDSDTDSEMDLDLTVDFMSLSTEAQAAINTVGKNYELGKSDFVKFLARDIEEAQELRNAKQQEEEKAMFSVSYQKLFYLASLCWCNKREN